MLTQQKEYDFLDRSYCRQRLHRGVSIGLWLSLCLPIAVWAGEPMDIAARAAETLDKEEPAPEVGAVKEEITVTSSLPELAIEVDLSSDELEAKSDSDLVESLRRVAGLSAVRRGPINLDPVIRGLQEAQIVATVDGARTFAAGPARMDSDLSHVGRHAVETIRIVKGPYALAWGAGALSAVELSTFQPQFGSGWGGGAGGSWGSNADQLDTYTNVWGGGDRYRIYLGVGHREGSDYESGDGATVAAGYESTDSRWRIGAQLTDQLQLDWSGGYQRQLNIDYPGRILDASYFYAHSHSLALTWDGDATVKRAYGQLYVNRKDHRMNNDEKPTANPMPGRRPPFGLRVDLLTESNTGGARFRLDLEGERTEWSLGSDYTRLEQEASRSIFRRSNDFLLFTDTVWPDVEIDTLGSWIQGVRRIGAAQWGATLRVDHVTADAGTASDFFRSIHPGKLEQDEDNLSAAISGSFQVGDHWLLQAGLGRAVRSATASERYSDRFPATQFQISAEVVGNPELDPEASLELDLGARYHRGKIVFETELFYRSLDDYITLVPDTSLPTRLPLSPPVVYRTVNGDRAVYYGAELSVDHRVSNRFFWHADLSWIRAEDKTFDEPVLGISPLTLHWNGRVAMVRDRLWLNLGWTWADDQDRVAASRFEQPTEGYSVVDLGIDVSLGDWSLEIGVENVADEAYADHLNAPNPFNRQRILEMGRSVQAGFRVGF